MYCKLLISSKCTFATRTFPVSRFNCGKWLSWQGCGNSCPLRLTCSVRLGGWGFDKGQGAGVKNFPVDWQIIKQHLNSWYVGDGVFANVEGRGRRECEFDYYFTSSSFIIKWNPDIFSLCTLGIFINIYLIKGCLWAVSLAVEGDELLAGIGRNGTISVRAHLSAGVDPD